MKIKFFVLVYKKTWAEMQSESSEPFNWDVWYDWSWSAGNKMLCYQDKNEFMYCS